MSVKEEIKVSCYEGYRAEEKPRCFMWRNQPFIIQEISEMKLMEDLTSKSEMLYDIVTSSGEFFSICYDLSKHKWYIKL